MSTRTAAAAQSRGAVMHCATMACCYREVPTLFTRSSVSVPSPIRKGVLPPPLRMVANNSQSNKLPNRCWHFRNTEVHPSDRAPRLLPGCSGKIPKLLELSIHWGKNLPSHDFSEYFPPLLPVCTDEIPKLL